MMKSQQLKKKKEEEEKIKIMKEMFKAFDKDGNGFIGKDFFFIFLILIFRYR